MSRAIGLVISAVGALVGGLALVLIVAKLPALSSTSEDVEQRYPISRILINADETERYSPACIAMEICPPAPEYEGRVAERYKVGGSGCIPEDDAKLYRGCASE